MSEKSKNLVTRTVTGVLFVAIMVMCILRPGSMVMLFAIITGMTVWEFAGLVNNMEGVEVNRLIATAAGVYLFLAFAGAWMGITDMRVFLPYLVTVVYMFVSELYNKSENPVNSWAYTMQAQVVSSHQPRENMGGQYRWCCTRSCRGCTCGLLG